MGKVAAAGQLQDIGQKQLAMPTRGPVSGQDAIVHPTFDRTDAHADALATMFVLTYLAVVSRSMASAFLKGLFSGQTSCWLPRIASLYLMNVLNATRECRETHFPDNRQMKNVFSQLCEFFTFFWL